MQRQVFLTFVGFAGLLLPLAGSGAGDVGDTSTPKELQPRPFTLKGKDMPLNEVLEKLYVQTGNRVVDRRKNKAQGKLALDLNQVGFWPGLEAIRQAAGGGGISLYEADGQMALVDRAPRQTPPTVAAGLFRLAIKRIGVTRDEESGAHTCAVNLEVAWEPRFRALYMQVGPKEGAISAKFAPDANKVAKKVELPERGQMPVAGRLAVEDVILLPAPARTAPRIDSLQGSVRAIGITKMLTFVFDPLKESTRKQEGVSVTVNLEKQADHWKIGVLIENPPGGPVLSSHQSLSWLSHNAVYLEKGSGDKKEYFEKEDQEIDKSDARGATIVYRFGAKRRPPPGRFADWRLVYRTPARIVELTAPFEFKRVPLP